MNNFIHTEVPIKANIQRCYKEASLNSRERRHPPPYGDQKTTFNAIQ
jgi:hypothetical protein